LSFLLSYSVVKEPTSRKGRQIARPSRPCQAECFRARPRRFASSANPSRLTRTPVPTLGLGVGKIELPAAPGSRSLCPAPPHVNIASGTLVTRYHPLLFQPPLVSFKDPGVSAGTCANVRRRMPIPSQRCTTLCASSGYRSIVRELLPRLGPVTTATPGVLFPDFGKMSSTPARIAIRAEP
jgi:hypothetical protein